MELIIKIPEELKEALDNAKKENALNYLQVYNDTIYNAIQNGVPIPKGHGKLIDADKTIANAYEVYSSSGTPCIINAEQMYAIRKVLTAAPGIIGANKAGVEKETTEEAEE